MQVTEALLRSGHDTMVGLEKVSDFVKYMKHKYCTEHFVIIRTFHILLFI
jgi:hypothetical protein